MKGYFNKDLQTIQCKNVADMSLRVGKEDIKISNIVVAMIEHEDRTWYFQLTQQLKIACKKQDKKRLSNRVKFEELKEKLPIYEN